MRIVQGRKPAGEHRDGLKRGERCWGGKEPLRSLERARDRRFNIVAFSADWPSAVWAGSDREVGSVLVVEPARLFFWDEKIHPQISQISQMKKLTRRGLGLLCSLNLCNL